MMSISSRLMGRMLRSRVRVSDQALCMDTGLCGIEMSITYGLPMHCMMLIRYGLGKPRRSKIEDLDEDHTWHGGI